MFKFAFHSFWINFSSYLPIMIYQSIYIWIWCVSVCVYTWFKGYLNSVNCNWNRSRLVGFGRGWDGGGRLSSVACMEHQDRMLHCRRWRIQHSVQLPGWPARWVFFYPWESLEVCLGGSDASRLFTQRVLVEPLQHNRGDWRRGGPRKRTRDTAHPAYLWPVKLEKLRLSEAYYTTSGRIRVQAGAWLSSSYISGSDILGRECSVLWDSHSVRLSRYWRLCSNFNSRCFFSPKFAVVSSGFQLVFSEFSVNFHWIFSDSQCFSIC